MARTLLAGVALAVTLACAACTTDPVGTAGPSTPSSSAPAGIPVPTPTTSPIPVSTGSTSGLTGPTPVSTGSTSGLTGPTPVSTGSTTGLTGSTTSSTTSSTSGLTGTPPPAVSTGPSRDPLADLVEGLDVVTHPVLGADVSWPQCPAGMGIPQKRSHGGPMPVAAARFVVIGLTNGPGFYANPCLASQVDWVRRRGLLAAAYAVASYPRAGDLATHGRTGPYDGSTPGGALANVGYQQALFNVASMRRAGLRTPVVWIDVEPVPDFAWSADPSANAAVVTGVAKGYADAGYRIGVYSTAALWTRVVGDLALGLPEWRAAGQTSRAEAVRRCGADAAIQGGLALMAQWVQDGRDLDLTCPGAPVVLSQWFHRY